MLKIKALKDGIDVHALVVVQMITVVLSKSTPVSSECNFIKGDVISSHKLVAKEALAIASILPQNSSSTQPIDLLAYITPTDVQERCLLL